jgi:hypothetical protein
MMVRYRVKPAQAARNEELVRAVYDELQRTQPAGLRYATFRMQDGVTFVHLAETDDERNPLSHGAGSLREVPRRNPLPMRRAAGRDRTARDRFVRSLTHTNRTPRCAVPRSGAARRPGPSPHRLPIHPAVQDLVPQRADKTVAAPTRQMPPRSTSSNAHQRVGVTASPRMQACGRRPQRLPDDHQQHESRVLLLDETTEKGASRAPLPTGLEQPVAVYRLRGDPSYAASARSAAPIGWRLTRTAVQSAWNVDFRAPR